MPIKPKHILIGGLIVGLIVVASGAAQAAETATNLKFALLPKVRSLNLNGLKVEVDAAFHNPKAGSLVITDPIIQMTHTPPGGTGKQELTTIDLTGQTLTIRPKTGGKLSDPDQLGQTLLLHVPYAKLIAVAPGIIAAMLGATAPYVIDVVSVMNVKAPNVPQVRFPYKTKVTISGPIT